MNHILLLMAFLLLLFGCSHKNKWEEIGNGLYRIVDEERGVVCYMVVGKEHMHCSKEF